MGASAVPFLHYNAAKASSGNQSDDRQVPTSRLFSLHCLWSSNERAMSTQYNVVCARSLIRRRNCPHRPAGSKNGGCHEWLMAGDITTYHERHSVAGWSRAARPVEVASPAAWKLRYYYVGMAAAVCDCIFCGRSAWVKLSIYKWIIKLECGPMPSLMAALPNIRGALCSMPQRLADAHY